MDKIFGKQWHYQPGVPGSGIGGNPLQSRKKSGVPKKRNGGEGGTLGDGHSATKPQISVSGEGKIFAVIRAELC